MKALCVALTLILMMLSAVAWGNGATLNKDFEDSFTAGVADGWSAFSIDGAPAYSQSSTVHHGVKAQGLDCSAGEGGVKAKFDAVIGSIYTIHAWVKVDSGAAYFTVMDNGEFDAGAATGWNQIDPSASWQEQVRTITAQSDVISVFLDEWGGVCNWDDLQVIGSTMQFEGGFGPTGIGNDWGPVAGEVCSPETTEKHSGAYSQKITTPINVDGGIFRIFNVTAGHKYAVSAWTRVKSGMGYYYVGPASGGGSWTGVPVNTAWQKLDEIYTATSNQMLIYLYQQGTPTGGLSYWDDVSITELVVEPTLPTSPYYRIFNQVSELDGHGNIYWSGGVFNGQAYFGQNSQCAQLWGDEQVTVPAYTYDIWDGVKWVPAAPTSTFSARVAMTQPWMPVGTYGPLQWGRPVAKCAIPLGGWIYMAGGGTSMFRTQNWWTGTYQSPITVVNTPNGEITDCICTDGQYIFAATFSFDAPNSTNVIHKYAVNQATGTLTNAPGWPVTVAGATGFSGISYYQGKIYAVDSGAPFGIYEIDATSGAATKLANFVYPNGLGDDTQIVRYGDQLFITCAAAQCNKLYTYTKTAGVWSATSSMVITDASGTPINAYGLAVKGDGTTAKYAWVTGYGNQINFYGLVDPWTSSPCKLGDVVWKNKHHVNLGVDSVVTAVGNGEFWIENKDRTSAARVIWSGTMPAKNHYVTVKGVANGSKVMTASEVTPGAAYTINPLFMNNQSMGPATGSTGLGNDGMLVTICGKVTYHDWDDDGFTIDDGSGVPSGIPSVLGVKVLEADGSGMYNVPNYLERIYNDLPSYAKVTGVVRLVKRTDGTVVRQIAARSDADIIITAR